MGTGQTGGRSSKYSDETICAEDIWVLNKLCQSRGISEQLMDDVVVWWQSEGKDQTLLVFLAMRRVIPLDVAQVLGEAAEGTLSPSQLPPCFTPERITALKRQVADFQQRLDSTRTIHEPGRRSPASTRRHRTVGGVNRRLQVGDTLGKCLLTHMLGRGATCSVFAALHQSLNITVAVKVFDTRRKNVAQMDFDVFREEAQTVARLNHPNIVRVLDFEEGDIPYLILEYVDGMSLLELIGRSGTIDPDQTLHIAKHTVKALQYAHNNGVIHRDIKPANILIDKAGEVKLTDLGLAAVTGIIKQMQHEGKQVLCGTPAYIAPEVALDASAGDHRSDIYSLGATLYHMVTGQYPYKAQSVEMMILKHVRTALTPPHQVRPGIGDNVSDLVCAMMHKSPEARFQNMQQVLEAIERVRQKPVSSPTSSTITTRIKTKLVRMLLRDENQ